MIIAAYAGCGKTTFVGMVGENAIDLHCLPYKYYLNEANNRGEAGKADPNNEMRPDWPCNYVSVIKDVMRKYAYVLIPSDFRVLALLADEGISYILIYPHRNCREEYLKRYIDRGNTDNFLSIFYEDWNWFIDRLEADKHGKHIVLLSGQFLSDVIITKIRQERSTNRMKKVDLKTFLADIPSAGADRIYPLSRFNLFSQMNDVWGEANRAVTGGYTGDSLARQMDLVSKICLRIYSNPEIANDIKCELRQAEWQLYDFCLWDNVSCNDSISVMYWFDKWNDPCNYFL
ncbi:MAG: hypothetical protein LBI44_01035 [Oscillospiraceae bacterium]|jgi:hypothetical protein|nr:hypothetical protein [Oscillospiraceae bacterium]